MHKLHTYALMYSTYMHMYIKADHTVSDALSHCVPYNGNIIINVLAACVKNNNNMQKKIILLLPLLILIILLLLLIIISGF